MSALKELVKNAEDLTEKRTAAMKEIEEIETATKGESGEARDLTAEEETRSNDLLTEVDGIDTELDELDTRLDEENKSEKRSRRIAEARGNIKSDGTDVQVTDEVTVYGEGSPSSYYADLSRRALSGYTGNDGGAGERLARHAHQVEREYATGSKVGKVAEKQLRELCREFGAVEAPKRMADLEARGRTALEDKPFEMEVRSGIATGGGATASASGGGGAAFVTPFFLSDYVPYRELGRPFIDQCNKQPLPPYGMEVYLPAVTGPAEEAEQTEGQGVAEKVIAAGFLAGGLITVAGQQVVTQQLLDRCGPNFAFDRIIFDALERDYAPKADKYVLSKALEGATEQSWTGNSGAFVLVEKDASGGFLGQIAKGKANIRTAAGTILNPTHLFVTQNRWDYISAFGDSNGRTLASADYQGPFNAAAGGSTDGDEGIEGVTGWRFGGLPVFQDGNIPNQGTTTQDQAVLGDLQEVWVFEGAAYTRVVPQTYAQNLQSLIQRWSYITCIKRYEKGVLVINGTAMKVPSYKN
jgi:hypothetical protein